MLYNMILKEVTVLAVTIYLLCVPVTYSFIEFSRNIFAVLCTQDLIHTGDHALSLDTKLLPALAAGRGGYQVVPRGESGAKICRLFYFNCSWSSIVTKCNTDVLGKERLEWKAGEFSFAHIETLENTHKDEMNCSI